MSTSQGPSNNMSAGDQELASIRKALEEGEQKASSGGKAESDDGAFVLSPDMREEAPLAPQPAPQQRKSPPRPAAGGQARGPARNAPSQQRPQPARAPQPRPQPNRPPQQPPRPPQQPQPRPQPQQPRPQAPRPTQMQNRPPQPRPQPPRPTQPQMQQPYQQPPRPQQPQYAPQRPEQYAAQAPRPQQQQPYNVPLQAPGYAPNPYQQPPRPPQPQWQQGGQSVAPPPQQGGYMQGPPRSQPNYQQNPSYQNTPNMRGERPGATPTSWPQQNPTLPVPLDNETVSDATRALSILRDRVEEKFHKDYEERKVPISRNEPLTVEDIVRQEVRVFLKKWLDAHLPSIVQSTVRREVERVVQHQN